MDHLIWWTAQEDYEKIGDDLEGDYPEYLKREYRSRMGRAGRGRLWVPSDIDLKEIPWDEKKPAARLASTRGGIAIHMRDAKLVFGLPGYLTDLEMNFVNFPEEPA